MTLNSGLGLFKVIENGTIRKMGTVFYSHFIATMTVSIADSIQYMNMTESVRRTGTAWQHRARLCMHRTTKSENNAELYSGQRISVICVEFWNRSVIVNAVRITASGCWLMWIMVNSSAAGALQRRSVWVERNDMYWCRHSHATLRHAILYRTLIYTGLQNYYTGCLKSSLQKLFEICSL